MNDKIILTRLELQTIIEDAFIDGWKQAEANDWYEPEDCLRDGDSETTMVIKDLMEE